MYTGLHVKYPLFLPDFNETWIFSTDFRKKNSYIKFHKNPSGWRRVVPCGQSFAAILRKRLKNAASGIPDKNKYIFILDRKLMGTLYLGYQACSLSVHFTPRCHWSHSEYTVWPGWESNKILLFELNVFRDGQLDSKRNDIAGWWPHHTSTKG